MAAGDFTRHSCHCHAMPSKPIGVRIAGYFSKPQSRAERLRVLLGGVWTVTFYNL